jgi:hypothetical protein
MTTMQIAAILVPIHLKIQQKYGKDYSFPSQEKVLEFIERYYGFKICRATLCRWYKRLRDEKVMTSIRRTKRNPIHGLQFKSTINIILLKGYHMVRSLGIPVWKEIKRCLEKLRFKYPEFAAKSTKKMLEAEKGNPQHNEFMRGIVEKLEKRHVIE